MLEMQLTWEKNESAREDWYYGFMVRHSNDSLRNPEALGRHRAIMGNDHDHHHDVRFHFNVQFSPFDEIFMSLISMLIFIQGAYVNCY